MDLKPVARTLPVAPYIGGKKVLARTVIARIDAIAHDNVQNLSHICR